MLQQLPIGIQDFRTLREDNLLYVDKTQDIYNLIQYGKNIFLSRPRRFGKSLLLSTIKELYLGNRAVFDKLWIADNWDWTKKQPVLHISMSGKQGAAEELKAKLLMMLDEMASDYGITLYNTYIDTKFAELIKKLSEQHGRVVVLIDEYDKPIIDYIDEPEILKENKKILSGFYGVLKDADPYLKFVLLTGVSKFSKVSIFSGLNNLKDITLNEQFATICGYTQTELEDNFKVRFERLANKNEMTVAQALAKTKAHYNGYSWGSNTKVYNPYSTLNLLDNYEFNNFWFESGSPTFLIDLLKAGMVFNIENTEIEKVVLQTASIETLDATIVLFQTGYLTIVGENKKYETFILDYPNKEVRESMTRFLLIAFSSQEYRSQSVLLRNLDKALLYNDIDALFSAINTLFATIPHQIFLHKYEAYFQSVLYLTFNLLGYRTKSEVSVHKGRIDWVVESNTHIYVVEFKINASASVAMAQIKDKNYYTAYLNQNKKVTLIGVNLDSESKSANEWLTEEIA
jgi:Predicted AAA-ATPase/PD-(D/E)XK nuclease superfamily